MKKLFGIKTPIRLFGQSLEECLENDRIYFTKKPITHDATIPFILQRFIAFLSSESILKSEGLFRRTGSTQSVKNLREALEKNPEIGFSEKEDSDINTTVTSLMKQWIRDVSGGLIPIDAIQTFQSLDQSVIYKAIDSLGPVRSHTLKYLLNFLTRVVAFESFNKMSVENLSIVFGPTVFHIETEDAAKYMELSSICVVLMKNILSSVLHQGQNQKVEHEETINAIVKSSVDAVLAGKPRKSLASIIFPSRVKGKEKVVLSPTSIAGEEVSDGDIRGIRQNLTDELKMKFKQIRGDDPEPEVESVEPTEPLEKESSIKTDRLSLIMKSKPRKPSKQKSMIVQIQRRDTELESPMTVTPLTPAPFSTLTEKPKKGPSRPAPPTPVRIQKSVDDLDKSSVIPPIPLSTILATPLSTIVSTPLSTIMATPFSTILATPILSPMAETPLPKLPKKLGSLESIKERSGSTDSISKTPLMPVITSTPLVTSTERIELQEPKLSRDEILKIKTEYLTLREKVHAQEPMTEESMRDANRYRELKLLIKNLQKPVKNPGSVSSPIKDCLETLSQKRIQTNRPSHIDQMTPSQVYDEKRDVKAQLTRLKVALAANPSLKNAFPEDKTAMKALYTWYLELKEKSESISKENSESRAKDLKVQKRLLQVKLHEYQDGFQKLNGRPVTSTEDWLPVRNEYKQYKSIRKELEKLGES